MAKSMQDYLDASAVILERLMGAGSSGPTIREEERIRDAVESDRDLFDWTEEEREDLVLLVSEITMWMDTCMEAMKRALGGTPQGGSGEDSPTDE